LCGYTPPPMQPTLSNWSTSQKTLFTVALVALLASSSFVALNLTNSGVNPLTPFWQIYKDGNNYVAKAPNGTQEFTSTDCASIIQTAWNLGDTHVASGSYALNERINKTSSNFELTGSPNAVLTAKNSFNDNLFAITNVQNVTISKIHIDGNQNNQQEQAGLDFSNSGIWIENCTCITVKDVTVTNIYAHGILAKNDSCCTFEGNIIINCGNNGGTYISEACILLYYYSHNCLVSGNHLSFSNRGVYLSAWATDNVVSDNDIQNCGRGVHLSSGGCNDNIIDSNRMNACNNTGVYIEAPSSVDKPVGTQNSVTNNQISTTDGGYGILVYNSTYAKIVGNTLNVGQPLTLYNGSDNALVNGNIFSSNGTNHFDVMTTSAKNGSFTNNICTTTSSHSWYKELAGASSNCIRANTISVSCGIAVLSSTTVVASNFGYTNTPAQMIAGFWNYPTTYQNGVVNQTFLAPVYIPQALSTIQTATFYVGTGNAGTNAIVSLWSDNGLTPQGGTLLWNTTVSVATSGGKTATINLNEPKGWYWVGVTTYDSTVTLFRSTSVGMYNDARDGATFTTSTFSLPTTCPTVTVSGTARFAVYLATLPITD